MIRAATRERVGSLISPPRPLANAPQHVYDADEAKARAAKLGVWNGEIEAPWLYRQRLRAENSTAAASRPGAHKAHAELR